MSDELSFGRWLQRRRKALDLTQEALGQRVGCAAETLRKIEADARRPSRQVAERLAEALELPEAERTAFICAARAQLSTDRLAPPTQSVRQIAFVPATTLPSGTVTFLFTDLEISTQLWERHTQTMQAALARHDAILRHAIEAHQGVIVKPTGDGIHAVFAHAPNALAAALTAQRALQSEAWEAAGPLRVRMALHTGVAEERDSDYFGPPLNRVARLLAAGHGGQVLLSRATQELACDHLPADITLRDMGTHRLKDLTRPEHIFQLIASDLPVDFPPLKTLDAHVNSLPMQPTPLLGRETDVARVYGLLRYPEPRLVTLTGPGGVGKTHLAFQVAAELLNDFPDGVYFINLAPISDPSLVATTIAQVLRIKDIGNQSLLERLRNYIRDKQLLLLLDNFEQVVAAAPLIGELLAAAPRLKVLITSREVLHLRGEKEYGVLPLALPDPKQVPTLGTLSQFAAVELFIARARDARPDFALTNDNASAVAEICQCLDGLPLAIELAAARVKLFAPEALQARLGQRLALLTGGARDLPARQQTLRNTIEWSYNLLEAGEQTLFRRLAVFVGGWLLEAVEAVCNVDRGLTMDVVDGVAALLNKCLLRQEEGLGGEPRFTMLETIREYALERLEASGEAESVRRRHAAYYLTLAEAAEPLLHGAEQRRWLDRLETEYNDLRAAAAWCRAVPDGAEMGLCLAGALWWFWRAHARWPEGRRWLADALAHPAATWSSSARATALNRAGNLASGALSRTGEHVPRSPI
jgi:predicted ATPase/class 3 adenylate cyclase